MTKRMKIEAALSETDAMYKPTRSIQYQRPLTSYRHKNRWVEAAVRELDEMYGRRF